MPLARGKTLERSSAQNHDWILGIALDGSSLVGLLIAMRGEGKMLEEAHLAQSGSPPATLSSAYAGGLHSTTARCSPVSWGRTACAGLDLACSLCVSVKWFEQLQRLLIVGAMRQWVGGLPL